jgi:hypothetical protein
MTEQDIAKLWERARSPWDGVAARAELRALGFNPLKPPPEIAEAAAKDAAERDAQQAPLPDAQHDGEVAPLAQSVVTAGEGGDDPSTAPPAASRSPSPSPCDGEDPGLPTPARPPAGSGQDRKKRPRHNEWNREKMAAFLRELASSQSVKQAAKSVGMSRQSAYRLRNRMVGTPFALAWEVALEAGMQQLAHALMDRALNGEEVPCYYRGELVGTRRRYDNRLGAWLLTNPWKVGRQQLAREHASRELDELLERIETEGPRWEPDGFQPNPEYAKGQREEDDEYLLGLTYESWYEADRPKPARAARQMSAERE